jgi:hypothetical protein
MKYLQNFSQFELIFESNPSWPTNLDSFPTWQILSDMGSTYRTNRAGNFEILTPYKDFKITSQGYVRDLTKAGTGSDLMADFRSDSSVDTLLIWIIQKIFPNFVSSHGGPSNPKVQALQARIDSLIAAGSSKLIHPHLSEDQVKLLNICARGWSYDPITHGIKVDTFDISRKSPQYSGFGIAARLKILPSLKFSELSHLEIDPGWDKKSFLSRLPVLPDQIFTFKVRRVKLSSLLGAPQRVTGDFRCDDNQLTTLEGAPLTVEGSFSCGQNQLTSLAGAPKTVGGYFGCDAFNLYPGKWNPTGWMKVLEHGSPEAQKLMATLPFLDPDYFNSELSRDPAHTINQLARIWSLLDPNVKAKIRIPPGYEDRFELRAGLSDLGLF